MAGKFKKGYYVNGRFVAENSETDLTLKREMKGRHETSRTDDKKTSDELQQLGDDLLTFTAEQQAAMGLSAFNQRLIDALTEAKRITNFEGKRRQMQFVGKLMRKLDDDTLMQIRNAMENRSNGSPEAALASQIAEKWRTDFLTNDTAVQRWMENAPTSDSQQLRSLIRQAKKDQVMALNALSESGRVSEVAEGKIASQPSIGTDIDGNNTPKITHKPHKPSKAYRELFVWIKTNLAETQQFHTQTQINTPIPA